MITHMDVFLLLTLHRKQYPDFPESSIVQGIILATGISLTPNDRQLIQQYPPTTQQMVHALQERGFSNNFISEYLKIRQPTVSYHSKRVLQKEYVNPIIRRLELDLVKLTPTL